MARRQFVPLLHIIAIAAFSEFNDALYWTYDHDLVINYSYDNGLPTFIIRGERTDCTRDWRSYSALNVSEVLEGATVGYAPKKLVGYSNQNFRIQLLDNGLVGALSDLVGVGRVFNIMLRGTNMCLAGNVTGITRLTECTNANDHSFTAVRTGRRGCKFTYVMRQYNLMSLVTKHCLIVTQPYEETSYTSLSPCVFDGSQKWFFVQSPWARLGL